jgi:hypothetical protein
MAQIQFGKFPQNLIANTKIEELELQSFPYWAREESELDILPGICG